MNTRKYSKAQEDKVAKAIGGKRQSNSGATPFLKGDVVTEHFLLECKTSVAPKSSMSIKKEWLDKLKEEKFAMGKPYSALAFNFGEGENYYIITEQQFIYLLACIVGENEEG